MATRAYVDGFNVYYRLVKDTDLKWLDLVRLIERVCRVDLELLRYFTARISERPGNPSAPQRQDIYLQALEASGPVTIHEGHFTVHPKFRPYCCPHPETRPAPEVVRVLLPEEKGSDVNLASYLLRDVYLGECDHAIVVTNDTDLVTPIRIAVEEVGVPVTLAHPTKYPAFELAKAASLTVRITRRTARRSQLTDPVVDPIGREIWCPGEWKFP